MRKVLFFVMSCLLLCPLMADDAGEIEPTGPATVSFEDGQRLHLSLDPEAATVGELATVSMSLENNGVPVNDVSFLLRFVHIEDDVDNFRTTLVGADGRATWTHQFFDGAAHKVIVEATSLRGDWSAKTAEIVIDVEGIQPPTSVILKSLVFLLGVTALGMAAGYVVGVKV